MSLDYVVRESVYFYSVKSSGKETFILFSGPTYERILRRSRIFLTPGSSVSSGSDSELVWRVEDESLRRVV